MNNKREIEQMVLNNIDYIPTLDELKLLGDDFAIGASPIFSILIHSKFQSIYGAEYNSISKDCISGTSELFSQLLSGKCETYSEERLFFVAYTLSKYKIEFDLHGFEYRNKLNIKTAEINRLLSILKNDDKSVVNGYIDFVANKFIEWQVPIFKLSNFNCQWSKDGMNPFPFILRKSEYKDGYFKVEAIVFNDFETAKHCSINVFAREQKENSFMYPFSDWDIVRNKESCLLINTDAVLNFLHEGFEWVHIDETAEWFMCSKGIPCWA